MTITPLPKVTSPDDIEPTIETPHWVMTKAHTLIHLATINNWRSGVELGTCEGKTAAAILSRCLWMKLVVVDLWEAQPQIAGPENWTGWPHRILEQAARNRLAVFRPRIRIFKGYSVAAADRVEDGSLDFVFIDADLSELGVRSDIMAWTRKLKKGGSITGAGINWPSVRRAADDLCPGYWIGPGNTWGIEI